MIARLWRGWTTAEDADAYESFLRDDLLPQVARLDGYHGGYVMRRDVPEGVEFVTMTMFESLDAVRAFAGEDFEIPVIEPRARELLSHFDDRAGHYDTVVEPD
jgi:hypothetical protein